MSDLRLTIMKAHDSSYGNRVRGMTVWVFTPIMDRNGEDSDTMEAVISVDDHTGRVFTEVSHVPRQGVGRDTLLDIAEAYREFARIAEEMQEAVKDIDPAVLAQCKDELIAINKEYNAVQKEIMDRQFAARNKRMAAYRVALADKNYGLREQSNGGVPAASTDADGKGE